MTKNYQPSMSSTLPKSRAWTSAIKKLSTNSNIATYGPSFSAGTTTMRFPKVALLALSAEITRRQRCRERCCCIVWRSPKKQVLYCIPNTSTKRRNSCLSRITRNSTKWCSPSTLRIPSIYRMDCQSSKLVKDCMSWVCIYLMLQPTAIW